MTRILVCADGFFRNFSPVSLEPYIDMFINSLAKNGNIVMPYIVSDIVKRGKFKNWYRKFFTYEEVKNFNPEIIFAFNNALDERFLKNLDSDCYIIASDTPIFWNNKDLIKKYKDKYSVLYFNNDFAKELNNEFDIPFEKQCLIPYTTDMEAFDLLQDKEISFVGNFNAPAFSHFSRALFKNKNNLLLKENSFKKLINEYIEKGIITSSYDEIFLKDGKCSKEQLERSLCLAFTNYERNMLLNALLDYDLHIYTHFSNLTCFDYNYRLFLKCHFDSVSTIKENEFIYNTSKISLNLPHYQAKTGFSWRVCDILASNSLLLSNPTSDLSNMFEVVPVYNSDKELKEMCAYYLKNDLERKDIVKECQKIINQKHRYIHLLKIIEDFADVKLINSNQKGLIKSTYRTRKIQKKYFKKLEKMNAALVE